MATMRDDLVHRLSDAGYDASVVVSLTPLVERLDQRRAAATPCARMGCPRPARPRSDMARCCSTCSPRAASSPARGAPARTSADLEFGATACKALYR